MVRAAAASRVASAGVMAPTSASSAIAVVLDAAREVQLRRRFRRPPRSHRRIRADLDHQRGRQHDDADGFAGCTEERSPGAGPLSRLRVGCSHSTNAIPKLAQHRGDLGVVVVLLAGERLRDLLADRLQEPARPAGHRPARIASTTSSRGHDGAGVVREVDVQRSVHLLVRVARRRVLDDRDLVAELDGETDRGFHTGVRDQPDDDELDGSRAS